MIDNPSPRASASAAWLSLAAARLVTISALQAQHPQLVHVSPRGSIDALTAATRNLRAQLADAFEGIGFIVQSVRLAGSTKICVRWLDGPTAAQVRAIAQRYQVPGAGESVTQGFRLSADAWRQAFGEATYVVCERSATPRARAQAA